MEFLPDDACQCHQQANDRHIRCLSPRDSPAEEHNDARLAMPDNGTRNRPGLRNDEELRDVDQHGQRTRLVSFN